MTPLKSYAHSGTVPIGGALLAIVAGGVVATIAGVIYAYAFYWIPIVYLNFVITLVFGGVIGGTVAIAAKLGKIRNNWVVAGIALLMTVWGLYVYWGSYLLALAGFGNVGLAAYDPLVIMGFAGALFEEGSWGIGKGEPITGWFLVLFWIAEVGTVLVVSLMASMLNADVPFCESCLEWADQEKGVARLDASGDEPSWQQVLGGDLPALAEFSPSHGLAQQFVRLDLARCPRCETSRFLTINKVQMVVDKNGNPTEKEDKLITNAMITPDQYAVVETCGALYREQLAQPEAVEDDEAAQDEAAQPGAAKELPFAWDTPPAQGEK